MENNKIIPMPLQIVQHRVTRPTIAPIERRGAFGELLLFLVLFACSWLAIIQHANEVSTAWNQKNTAYLAEAPCNSKNPHFNQVVLPCDANRS